jgi:hypothetical protein
MNERIKELLTEARLFCYNDGTVSLMGETYVGQPELEKFAELIVRECANQCGNVLDYHAILERFGFEFKWSQE